MLKQDTTSTKKTMRIAEESIDKFLEFVGELIVIREMFEYVQKSLNVIVNDSTIIEEFRRVNDSFSELSRNLEKSIMAIRKLPLSTVLQKIPRIIRDIASLSGKEIDVAIEGENIEIDKSLLEALEAPLVHMARNAADHGIENPELRVMAGKPRCGSVRLTINELPDTIEIKLCDDGAGLNLEAIQRKAEKLGLAAPEKKLTDDQIIKLLFIAGVTTAEKVTDISGRGVGMDVVRQNIDKINGKISVVNHPGKGVDFSIVAPKNIGTQIINGFMVRVVDESFILPLECIIESFNASQSDFTNVVGRGTCVKRREKIIPFKALGDVFGFSKNGKKSDCSVTVIVINHKGTTYGFGIDEILGIHQIVLKPINGLHQADKLFSGAAITGSGKVSMILNIENIIEA